MDIETILQNIPDKRQWKTTTSLQLKRDLYKFFNDKKMQTIVELGTHHGHTTRVLSYLFENVITYDITDDGHSKKFNQDRTNINHRYEDVYQFSWWEECQDSSAVFVDAIHRYDEVCADIRNSLKLSEIKYIIFDDYGMFSEVRRAVKEFVKNKEITPSCYIGEPPGSDCRPGKLLSDWEGVICEVNKGEKYE